MIIRDILILTKACIGIVFEDPETKERDFSIFNERVTKSDLDELKVYQPSPDDVTITVELEYELARKVERWAAELQIEIEQILRAFVFYCVKYQTCLIKEFYMKKIPTLFERQFENHNIKKVLPSITPGCEWVLSGEGVATVKWDGACCAVIGGELYKRYDAKHGKPIPEGAIKCQIEADPVTGHLPCWVKCQREHPADKWFWAALDNTDEIQDGTYEAIGPHFQSNPYNLDKDILKPHGEDEIDVPRSFDGIRDYLKEHDIEGIVFWKDGEPGCKIKRSDFGFPWGQKRKE